jgi:hypothetical protein
MKNAPQCKPFFAIAGEPMLLHSFEDGHDLKTGYRIPGRIVAMFWRAGGEGATPMWLCSRLFRGQKRPVLEY